jgi:hypothetical protein
MIEEVTPACSGTRWAHAREQNRVTRTALGWQFPPEAHERDGLERARQGCHSELTRAAAELTQYQHCVKRYVRRIISVRLWCKRRVSSGALQYTPFLRGKGCERDGAPGAHAHVCHVLRGRRRQSSQLTILMASTKGAGM